MHLDSIQILCVVLWLQSENVRVWPLTISVLLEAPQQFLAPLPNQVTAGMDLPCLLHLVKASCMCSSVTDWIHSVDFIPFMCFCAPQTLPKWCFHNWKCCVCSLRCCYTHTTTCTLSSSAGKFELNSWPTCDNQQCFWWAANSGMLSSSHHAEPWLHFCGCLQQLVLSVILVCLLFCFYHCSPISSSSHTDASSVKPDTSSVDWCYPAKWWCCDVLWVNQFLSPLRLDPETPAVCRQWWLRDHPLQWRGVLQLFRRRRPSQKCRWCFKSLPHFSSPTLSEPWPSLTGWFQSCWVVSAFWYNSSRSTNTPPPLSPHSVWSHPASETCFPL